MPDLTIFTHRNIGSSGKSNEARKKGIQIQSEAIKLYHSQMIFVYSNINS
jgi:hypothetical protein